jgi:hypothetical protein
VPAQLRICADAYVTRTAMAHGRLHSIDVPLGFYRVHGENNWVDNARRRDPKTVVDEIMALVLAYYHAQRVRGVTVPSGSKPARAPSHKSWLMADVAVRRMRALKRRYKRVALYGAGAHTSWLMELLTATRTYPQRMPEIVAVLDHLADSRPNVAGFTIQRPQDVPASAFDAIVLSTSRFQAQMRKRLRKVYKKPITIDLFADLPSTWFLPISPESYLAAKRQGRRRRRASPPSSETRQRRTA